MVKVKRTLLIFLAFMLLMLQAALAAAPSAAVQNVRYSNTAEKLRIVLDMDQLPAYSAQLFSNPASLLVDLGNTQNRSKVDQLTFDDAVVANFTLTTVNGNLQAAVKLNAAAPYRVFTLTNPNRVVIDIDKGSQKIEKKIASGVVYSSWSESLSAGKAKVHVLKIDPKQGYTIKPVLSNDAIDGLETVSAIADRYGAAAAVNASYFAPDGEIIGLLKINGEIVSIPELPRTALGILPDGSMLMDSVSYSGSVELPNGAKVNLDGVNCERGPNGLIIYNHYFDKSTGTNAFGNEYVIKNGIVQAAYVNQGDTAIEDGTVVLSGHGQAAAALSVLKVGDKVTIRQTLGDGWDKTVYVVGAGPDLVKDGAVSVTAADEQFLPDIAVGRAPRTALGLTSDGKIILAVIDGRQSSSIGMTLNELAQFMVRQGAVRAMNFDGGGSSEMVAGGKVMNSPSDGSERRIGSALIVVEK